MSVESIDRLCNHCGQTFSTFLHEMEEQNAKVVCPDCRENADCHPPQSTPGTATPPTPKPNFSYKIAK